MSLGGLFYSDTFDELGAVTGVRELILDNVEEALKQGKGITFGHKVHGNQMNLARIKVGVGEKTLLTAMHDVQPYDIDVREALFNYFLENYLCYVEVPTYRFDKETGERKSTFDKNFMTSNLKLAQVWAGYTFEEAKKKWGGHLGNKSSLLAGEPLTRLVKLATGKGERKVVKHLKEFNLSTNGLRVVPLFALEYYVESLYEIAKSRVVRVSTIKDNGEERIMDFTFNFDIYDSYYKDASRSQELFEASFKGDFFNNPTMTRGYIRIPELGASRYDSGLRAVSYSRIFKVEYNVEPDVTFIDTNLSQAVHGFTKGIRNIKSSGELKRVVDTLIEFGFESKSWYDTEGNLLAPITQYSLIDWAITMENILSTTFQRKIALFTTANPQWFDGLDSVEFTEDSLPESSVGSSNSLLDLDDLI